MRYLSQRDLAWANERLGSSKLTMGRFGCTTTCLSMISDYFKGFKSPIELAHNINNYTIDGLVLWKSLRFPTMRFVDRIKGENRGAIMEALKNRDKAVILQVNDGAHWVVGVRKTMFGDDYVIVDPWDGKKKTLKATYKNVTGAALFVRA